MEAPAGEHVLRGDGVGQAETPPRHGVGGQGDDVADVALKLLGRLRFADVRGTKSEGSERRREKATRRRARANSHAASRRNRRMRGGVARQLRQRSSQDKRRSFLAGQCAWPPQCACSPKCGEQRFAVPPQWGPEFAAGNQMAQTGEACSQDDHPACPLLWGRSGGANSQDAVWASMSKAGMSKAGTAAPMEATEEDAGGTERFCAALFAGASPEFRVGGSLLPAQRRRSAREGSRTSVSRHRSMAEGLADCGAAPGERAGGSRAAR